MSSLSSSQRLVCSHAIEILTACTVTVLLRLNYAVWASENNNHRQISYGEADSFVSQKCSQNVVFFNLIAS